MENVHYFRVELLLKPKGLQWQNYTQDYSKLHEDTQQVSMTDSAKVVGILQFRNKTYIS